MNSSIEETIDRVEQLYATITGHRPPQTTGDGALIPPETDPARHVEDQLGKLLVAVEQRLAPVATQGTPATPAWQPRVIAWHDDSGFELAIDVPGVARESLEVTSDGQTVIVRGHRAPPWGELARAPIACEAPFGAFARAFPLPARVEPAQISARLDGGVLRLRIAQPEQQFAFVNIR